MTHLLVRGDPTARAIAVVHERLVAAERAIRDALEAADAGATLTGASTTALHRLRERVEGAVKALEPEFLARAPGAPFANRTEPQRWLQWLDARGFTDGLRPTATNGAHAADGAAPRCVSVSISPADATSDGAAP